MTTGKGLETMKISSRAGRLEPSATLAVTGKAKALKSKGKNVISFGAGEPDFASPPEALRYAREAMERGETHYTAANGIPELKKAVAEYYARRFDLIYDPADILVGTGAKPLLYYTLGCIVDPGEEVLVLSPAWVSYVEQIRLLDAVPVEVDTRATNYLPTVETIAQAITPRTTAIILNSPCNPTGMVLDRDLLRGIGRLAEQHDLWIIWDEIYERLVYGETVHHNLVQLMPELRPRTIVINGVSKAFAMTGWRIGYALGPSAVMEKIAAFQGHITSNACSIAQWASLGALRGGEEEVRAMHAVFSERRDLMVKLLRDMPLVTFPEPRGAFYVFVDISACMGKTHGRTTFHDDMAFCEKLLESELVAAVPGSAFLCPEHVRFSYSNATEEIVEGMARFRRFLESLS